MRTALAAVSFMIAFSLAEPRWLEAEAAPAVYHVVSQPAARNTAEKATRKAPETTTHGCAICAAMSLSVLATPTLFRLPEAVELLQLTTGAEFVHLKSAGETSDPPKPHAS